MRRRLKSASTVSTSRAHSTALISALGKASGAPNKLSTDALSIPGAPTVDVPGVGKTPSKTLVAIGLLLLALAIMVLAIRGVPARRKPRSAAASRPIDLGASIAATPHEPSADKPPRAEGETKPG